ncbi:MULTISPECIES: hypothetical protein [Calothrix]|uniref:Uncharacterized protein n=2 Tax=Calothrix TaxID=1186 RepID=A0ABR8AMJ9_9CYAN|nr:MULTISPECIES: hypothetical protein [Calothrix]MBD2200834.1 hypothetical protein [Calothrix parietina FACHB-288]MBD2229871.1 hypothetical protein [Calothrix anomala FACHB-343]BAY66794.1 hypothetical protein NIES22_69380 [Calothrix brevissima NIES-22]
MPKPGYKTITVPDWIIDEIKRQPDYQGNQAATLGRLIKDAVAARSGDLESPELITGRILNHLPHWDRNKSWELALTILSWLQESERSDHEL